MEIAEAFPGLAWGECIVQPTSVPPAIKAEVKKAIGVVPGWVDRMAANPWLVRAFSRFGQKRVAHVPPALTDLITLVVSQDNSCRYCFGVQHALLRVLGYDQGYIDRLERDFHVADLTPAQRAALDFARKISRANPRVGPREFAELAKHGFTPPAIAEIAALAAMSVFHNRVATVLALPPEALETMVDQRLFKMLRPLIAWRMRRQPVPPEPAPRSSDRPCAAVVAALDGSPAAGAFRDVIDDAWASNALPRRTKALMLAVVARALGCPATEREARDLAVREGVGSETIDEVLATLGSRELDAREAALVPFARDTVRAQPEALQRRLREVTNGAGAETILEVAGTVALANAVCRLTVLLDLC